ncbi:MAG TPA: gamma-glutamyltransferase [Kofleriaceae bacterium]|nr:gamma-glutamyltransferase [Kofleriaceae bacterium]
MVTALAIAARAAPATAEPAAQPLRSTRGAVAADNEVASKVGAEALADGGNAVDAAVATALALGVVSPGSSGIGGGGFALVWDADTHTLHVYDFREVAPAALDPGDFVVGGKPEPKLAQEGGLAVGVPGEVRGLAAMTRRHGRLSWRRLVAPAARLARDGAAASGFFAYVSADTMPDLPPGPTWAPMRALLGGDAPIAPGEIVVRGSLARTLLAIARDPEAFYRGPIADDTIATIRAAGGVMTAQDLAAYQIVERAALWGTWRGHRLATMPIPSSGGVIILEALGILERTPYDLRTLGAGTAPTFHVIAEALKHAFADRAKLLGDSDAGRDAAAALLDDARLRRLARTIELDRTHEPEAYGEMPKPDPRGGTSHVCVIDAQGNAVSLTTTVNGYFGSFLVTDGGVVLNDQIDDFMIDPTVVNAFGLTQSEANLVGPGKRPLSSMSPTLVFDASGEHVIGCAGGSGGPRIISFTMAAIINAWLFELDAYTAVASQRVHHQWSPDTLRVDPAMTPAMRAELTKRGHVLVDLTAPTAVQLIKVLPDGVIEAASDPRKGGVPAAP